MRINKFVATATGLSRRKVDKLLQLGRIKVNNSVGKIGQNIEPSVRVTLDNRAINLPNEFTLILLNKPVGYICSRLGQGQPTIYDLLPQELHHLKTVGRLDKNSSGLLLLTDNGDLSYKLTHPSQQKIKKYQIILDKPLSQKDEATINAGSVQLDGRPSSMKLTSESTNRLGWLVVISEGRNQQIRRTFSSLNYTVVGINRTEFGEYRLGQIKAGSYLEVV